MRLIARKYGITLVVIVTLYNIDQKMSPELLNKAFSTKSTQCIYCIYHEKPNGTLFSTYKTGM